MASLGLRAFSGISVGLFGSLIGVHWSLALSALATLAIAGGLLGAALSCGPKRKIRRPAFCRAW